MKDNGPGASAALKITFTSMFFPATVGLWLIAGRSRSFLLRAAGIVSLSLPHLIGAPAAAGDTIIPSPLLEQFKLASLATTAMFWLLLGAIGGFIYGRAGQASGR